MLLVFLNVAAASGLLRPVVALPFYHYLGCYANIPPTLPNFLGTMPAAGPSAVDDCASQADAQNLAYFGMVQSGELLDGWN